MRFTEALYYALKIKTKFPSFKLCGSVALILAGKLPVRDVEDIDFVCNEKDINVKGLEKCCDYDPIINEKDKYKSYKLRHNVPYPFNLLVFENDVEIKSRDLNIKIPVQDTEQMLFWKIKYGREKDKEDLRNIEINTTKL